MTHTDVPADMSGVIERVWGRAQGPGPGRNRVFAVLPDWREPRLLVPAQSRAVAARGMLDFSEAVPMRTSLTRIGAAVGMLTLGASRFGERFEVPSSNIEDHLETVLGCPVAVVVGVGTRRANRKPVMRVVDSRGRLIAVAKLAVNELTARLVDHEHAALLKLGSRRFSTVRVPEVIWYGDWSGFPMLVMEALPTVPRPPWRPVRTPDAAMVELATAFPSQPEPLGDSAFMAALRARVDSDLDERSAGAARTLLEAVTDRVGDDQLAMGAWHGDFTEWNISVRGGRVMVWDWEQFGTDVPVGLDLVHFRVNHVTSREGVTPQTITSAMSAAPPGLSTRTWLALTLSYLATIAVRYQAASVATGERSIESAAAAMWTALQMRLGDIR